MNNVGFSGSRYGMTHRQNVAVRKLLAEGSWTTLHHGDCVGSDAVAHEIARDLGLNVCIHPPRSLSRRAGLVGDKNFVPTDYLRRNRNIVGESEALIATPSTIDGAATGGTWYTIQYALQHDRKLFVVSPAGRIMTEESVRRCLNV